MSTFYRKKKTYERRKSLKIKPKWFHYDLQGTRPILIKFW